mmetsp:Transcript_3913/g.9809  ORF Transcript_3913/g.9809 Transcript_3913/m.9809 type:complete len:342 (-) Transcript_3913:19-1044(-)
MHALRPLLLCVRVAAMQRAEIIAAPSARELERVAPQLISDGDSVLSAGVALESQAEMLRRLAGRVVSVDVPRKASRSRGELFRSDEDLRPLTRAGDVTAALRPDENFDCVVVDAAALLGFDLPLDTLALCEALRRRQPEKPPTVLVRSSALATLSGRLVAGDDIKRIARVLRMHDERPVLDAARIYEAQPVIVGARGVQEYRNCIDTVVRPGDRVLELGCHFGTTTAMLANKGYALGVDVGTSIIASAREQHPTIDFMVGDAWGVGGLARLGPWDAVFVDVGGLSGADGTLDALALARSLGAALEPRAIVMKSKCLRKLAKSLAPSTRLENEWDHERIEYV